MFVFLQKPFSSGRKLTKNQVCACFVITFCRFVHMLVSFPHLLSSLYIVYDIVT